MWLVCCMGGFGDKLCGWRGRGRAWLVKGLSVSVPLNNLALLELPTKVLNPTVSLSARATRETAAPTCPGYLFRAGFSGLIEAEMGPRV